MLPSSLAAEESKRIEGAKDAEAKVRSFWMVGEEEAKNLP